MFGHCAAHFSAVGLGPCSSILYNYTDFLSCSGIADNKIFPAATSAERASSSWSITVCPSLNLTCKLASHQPDSSLLIGMQNNTCYHTRNPRKQRACESRAFIMLPIPANLVDEMFCLIEGTKLLFQWQIWKQKRKEKRSPLCDVPSVAAGTAHEGKLIQRQICWTNTVIIWSSGVFVIKPRYSRQESDAQVGLWQSQ